MYMYKYIFTILKLSGTLRTFLYIDGQNDRKHPSTTINFYYFQSNHASNGDIENEIDDDENNQDVTSIVGKNDTKYIQENITIPLPSFIIIGTQKGGTDALQKYLQKHPSLDASHKKEPHFFDWHCKLCGNSKLREMNVSDTQIQDLREHYASYWNRNTNDHDLLRFEKTPSYMWQPNVAANLKVVVPQAKILISLRDPVERAYSHFKMSQKENMRKNITIPFETCIEEDMEYLAQAGITNETIWTCDDNEKERRWIDYWNIFKRGGRKRMSKEKERNGCGGEIGRGLYFLQLKQWFDEYNDETSRKFIFTFKSESLKPEITTSRVDLKPVTDFLGIEEVDVIAKELHKSKDLRPMKDKTRKMLRRFYEPFNQMLYSQLGEGWENPWPYDDI